ncbi:glycosyltransferase family 4 protein [Alienimonas californiensis]|uniref:Alpha-D-kanosaminyltransferase n=1 Tax=Alienimonas californiensis TaxID=2527989 RepID=A0A517P7Z7_9PLAN|nr:glycosyltransferase family 4 protein [Alienimonas californiensis]QDT15483.1 Alpha-D-kanosaminyltransferase [Alienimonas californiensis]
MPAPPPDRSRSRIERYALVAGDFRLHGGMDRPNYELAWHLAEREGATVELVAHHVAAPLAEHPRVRWTRVPRPGGRALLGRPLLARAGRRIAREVARAGGRTIANGANCAPLVGPPAAAASDVNWVHYLHAAAPPPRPATGRGGLRPRLVAARDRRAERRALRAAGLIVADSDRLAGEITERLGVPADRVHRIYYGVDPAAFRPPDPAECSAARLAFGISNDGDAGERPVVAFVGGLGADRRKGFDVLYDAWRDLMRSDAWPRSARLLVAGSGSELPSLRAAAERDGLADSIRFLGQTDRVPELLAAADLLVAPTFYEPYGQGVHEALCRGVPALVTETAGVAERYPADLRDLLLPDPPDAATLAARLRAWRANRAELAERTLVFAEELRSRDWEAMAAEFVALLRRHPPAAAGFTSNASL